MNNEIEALLSNAKANLSAPGVETEGEATLTALDAVKSIPKLQDTLNTQISDVPSKKNKEQGLKPIALRNAKEEKPDTSGKLWFDLGKPEMTPQLKRDLQLLKMRHVLDPKRFYKKEDAPSKYFAVGTIKEDPTEFFSARLTRKERKHTLAEEVLSTRSDYFRSKYRDIQKAKTSGRRKHQKKLKDMRA